MIIHARGTAINAIVTVKDFERTKGSFEKTTEGTERKKEKEKGRDRLARE